MSPFFVHEVYFTWPKLLEAAFSLTALILVLERRPLWSGLTLGVAYIAHPAALLAVPLVVLAWAAVRAGGANRICSRMQRIPFKEWIGPWLRDSVWLVGGVLAVWATWRAVNTGHNVDHFSAYLLDRYGVHPVSIGTWVNSQLDSLASTLVPFRFYFADAGNKEINVVGGHSPGIVQFSFSYHSTLPFATGLLYFPVFLYGLARFARRAGWLFLAVVVAPFVAFTVYWGDDTSGMLREGLQLWFILAVLCAFIGYSVLNPGRGWPAVRLVATLRAVEVAFLVLAPTLVTMGAIGPPLFRYSDLFAWVLMVGGIGGLAAMTWWAFRTGADLAAATRDTAEMASIGSGAQGRHQ